MAGRQEVNFAPWQRDVFDQAVRGHREGKLAHALLLVGPAHMGKRDVAEALAKRLLCASPGPDELACGHCRSCRLFPSQSIGLATSQAHPDLQRIGLEPNEKGDKLRTEVTVDQVRRLSQWFSLTPQFGGAQIAIVDPADLMNQSAANALLKTLEEPAPNRYLLLVTSRPGRLPATIRSRCQRLEFRLPAPAQARAWLADTAFAGGDIEGALLAARGNPGLAAHWLRHGGLGLRDTVLKQLTRVAAGKDGPIEIAQAWLADELAELRLRFAAEIALEVTGEQLGVVADRSTGLTPTGDVTVISNWFDAINRTRGQLGAPVRNDLVLAGLLLEWRNMFQQARSSTRADRESGR